MTDTYTDGIPAYTGEDEYTNGIPPFSGDAETPHADQNARLLGKSVNVAPTGEFISKNMAFHRQKREANPIYQSIESTPQNEHPFHKLARIATPHMLDAVDAFKSVIEHFDPKLEKSRFFAQKAMDAMAAGTYSEAGTALQLARLLKGEGNFRDLIHKGVLSGPEVLFGVGPGKDTRTFNAEALQEMGVKNPWIAYPAGFALDLAANPYNILKGAGLSKIGKAAEMFTQARTEEQMAGTAMPNWEAMAKNGNREARTIVKLLKSGQEDKLNMGVTLAEKVERGQYLFPGVQLPGMKRINVGKMKWAMDDATWAKVMEDHPGIMGKYKPGDVLPKDVMKKLVDAYKDDAFKMVTLHPETKIRPVTIPFPDIHNPVAEAQVLPKPLAEGAARLMTKGNRYLREFNPELLKPGVGAIPGAYGKLRKASSSLMQGLDEAFHKYPQQIIEGKMGDPRIYDGTVRWLRMAMNQKGDLSREAVDALFDLQTQGGDKNAILKLMRHLKVDKAMPDTYRAAETAMSSPMAQEEWARVRSSLEEAPRVVVADRALPDEWELRHFGTNDPAQIQRQAGEAIAGAWDDTSKREMVQGISTLEKRLNQHRMDVASLRNAERQAAYSGDARDAARLKEQADELEKSADLWDQTYRKIFGKSMIHIGPAPEAPVPPQMPRRPMLQPTQDRLRIAQAAAEGLDADLQSVAAEQRALAGSLEAAPPTQGVTNETLARLERANQRAAALQAQMQQRAAEIQRLQDRLAAEGEIDGMVQKVQAGLDKAHETDTAEEIARLEAHPAMKRPAGSLKEVRDERSRLTRDEFEAFKEQKVGEFLKARYGDDPEDYKAMLEKRAAAYDRSVFKSRAAKSEKAAAKGLRSVAREAEPAAPEPPSLAAPAWRLKTPAVDPAAAVDELRARYPKAGETVGGLKVRPKVDNTSSIGASLDDYEELGGIREISRSEFTAPKYDPSKATTVDGRDRALALADEIRKSGEITPLIVAIDKDGPYILEGGHRFDALDLLGVDKFPAVIVRDLGDFPAAKDAAEEIITAPGKTWHDFTLHPPDIQARIEGGEGVETGWVDATGKFFTREEAAAQGLKMGSPKASSEAMLRANSATPKQNPHWWHPGYTNESRAKAFDALPEDADVWVFTAMDDATADKFLKEGIKAGEKPSTLAQENYALGKMASFGPGKGLSPHLYVGSDPLNVDGYGRRILALKVKKGSIQASPEQLTLGTKSPGDAISLSDAVVTSDVPKENIIDTKISKSGVTAQEFMSKAFVVEKKTVQPNRPAIGKPRVPLKGSGLPVPSNRPTTSAIEKTSFGANNPPTTRDFIANREAGGSTVGLLLTGGQDMHGGLPPIDGGPPGPGGMSMPEYQAWVSKTLGESPEIGDDLAKEVADNLVKLSKEGWAKRRAIRDLVDGLIWTEDGRQAIVHAMPEYFPHVSDNVAAYSKPLAYVLGGPPKGGLRTPGFANARKFKDTFDDIQRSYKLVNGKPLLVDDVVTTLMNRVASSIQFQVHNDMLNGMLSSMGLSGKEILDALKAEGITEIPNARAAANIVNSHYWMRKMGYPEEAIKKVEALNKSLIDLGVWRTGGGPSDVQAAEGVADRLAAIVRNGTVPMSKASKEAPETVDLPDGVKNLLKKALGVTEDADLANPANNTDGRLQGTAAAILKKIRRTMKDRDALAPPLKLFITKGELARLADAPDFVNVLSVAKGLRASDMAGDWRTLVNLDPSTIPNFKELDKFGANYFLIPEELANHINGGVRTFLDDSGPRNLFARFYHGATNIWKQSVTTIFPEFHLRNWLTNMYQLQVYAGIDDPAIYWQARKIQLGIPGALLRDDGSVLTHAEVMRLAQKTGVAGHGYFGSDVQELLDPRKGGRVGRVKGFLQSSPLSPAAYITYGRDMGRFVEENARIAGFAHYLKQGYSPYAASMMVKKFLFDYSELSRFERDFLRGVFPFYAWMRKNIPLQVEQILSKPATMSVSRDIQHAVSGLVNGKDLTPEQFANLPDWLKPMLPILYKNRKDKPKVTAVAGKMSPVSDVMALGQDIGQHGLLGPAVYGVGALNPILKETGEQAFKRDLETGRPLFDVEGRTRPLHLPEGLVAPTSAALNKVPLVDWFKNTPGKGLIMLPERTTHALQNMRAISFMNSTMKDTEADTTAAQNAETILKNLAGLRSYDVDFERNYQIEGRKLKKEAQDMAPFKDGRVNFDSPAVKEILSRNRKRGEGVPPVSPEERKRFTEQMKKKLEEYRRQRAQRP